MVLALGLAACGGVDDNNADDPDAGDNQADAGDNVDAPDNQVAEAPLDNDSLQAPAETHFLSITGERNFTYTDEISAPTGDAEDFIEFEFPNDSNPAQVVRITFNCTLTGQLDAIPRVTIFENEVATNMTVDCNSGEQTLTVDNTAVQVARMNFSSVNEATHLDYSLVVVGFQ